jgi:hypothetical protein
VDCAQSPVHTLLVVHREAVGSLEQAVRQPRSARQRQLRGGRQQPGTLACDLLVLVTPVARKPLQTVQQHPVFGGEFGRARTTLPAAEPGGLAGLQTGGGFTVRAAPGANDMVDQVVFIVREQAGRRRVRLEAWHDCGQMKVHHLARSTQLAARLAVPERKQYLAVVGYEYPELGVLDVASGARIRRPAVAGRRRQPDDPLCLAKQAAECRQALPVQKVLFVLGLLHR